MAENRVGGRAQFMAEIEIGRHMAAMLLRPTVMDRRRRAGHRAEPGRWLSGRDERRGGDHDWARVLTPLLRLGVDRLRPRIARGLRAS